MRKSPAVFGVGILSLSIFLAHPVFSETIELVTYYPAPGSGASNQHFDTLTVGDPYDGVTPANGVALISTGLWLGAGFDAANPPPPGEVLHVAGRAGFDNAGLGAPTAEGTVSAGDKLVMWNAAAAPAGPYKAAIGLNNNNELWLQSSGNNTNNKITFYTSTLPNAAPLERMRIDANGNVGIGVAPVPNYRFQVQGADNGLSNVTFMPGAATVPGLVPEIRVGIGAPLPVGPLHVVGRNDALSYVFFAPGVDTAAVGAPNISLADFGSLSVGSLIPANSPLQTPGTFITAGAANAVYFMRRNLGVIPVPLALGDAYAWYAPDATHASIWASGLGDIMSVTSNRRVGIGTTTPRQPLEVAAGPGNLTSFGWTPGVILGAGAALTWDKGGQPNYFFMAHPSGGPPGNFWAGFVPTINGASAPIYSYQIFGNPASGLVGTVQFFQPIIAAGQVFPSDERFKIHILPLTGVLDRICGMQAISFEWNELYEAMGHQGMEGKRTIGLTAQEVERAFPELVTTWGEKGYKGVDYSRMTTVLVEAVKELKAENDQLKQKVEADHQEIQTLKKALSGS